VEEAILQERLRRQWAGNFIYPDITKERTGFFSIFKSDDLTIKPAKLSKYNIIKAIVLTLVLGFRSLSYSHYFLILSNFFFIYILICNLYTTSKLFFYSYQLKRSLLFITGFGDKSLLFSWIFTQDLAEIFLFNQFQFILGYFLWKLLFSILMIIPVLLIIAYSTLLERKVLSAAQRRRGPNKVGIKGSAQPLIDGIKLIIKEIIIPVQSENKIFLLSSIWSIFFMLLLWFVIPTSRYGNIIQFNYELLSLFCISVLGSISILLAGWSSNSKYAFLGGVWAGAQMISYELVLGLIVLIVMSVTCSTQIIEIVDFQELNGPLFFYLPLETILFLILIVAETNRAPFDFAEAESELVSGYNTEYSGLPFAFFFIAEYGNILYMSLLTSLLFFGGWSVTFVSLTDSNLFFLETIILFLR
jgi:NADH:ubiquinone oxidoreductase subunit H